MLVDDPADYAWDYYWEFNFYNFYRPLQRLIEFAATSVLGLGHEIEVEVLQVHGPNHDPAEEGMIYLSAPAAVVDPDPNSYIGDGGGTNVNWGIHMLDVVTLTPKHEDHVRAQMNKLCKALGMKTIGDPGYKLVTAADNR